MHNARVSFDLEKYEQNLTDSISANVIYRDLECDLWEDTTIQDLEQLKQKGIISLYFPVERG